MRPRLAILFGWFVLLVLLAVSCTQVDAQWGGGGCAPQGPVGPIFNPVLPRWTPPQGSAPTPPAYRWVAKDGWQQLWLGDRQLGSWNPESGYRKLQGPAVWGPPTAPPVTPPLAEKTAAKMAPPTMPNFGLELDKLGQDGCKYKINGQPCQRQDVLNALKNGNLQDDSRKPRLVIIGPDADRQQVLADLKTHPALAPLTRGFVIQDYPADHWHVAQAGFVTTGKPSIYLQLPLDNGKGKVLHHQDDYQGSAPALATAIRKADTSYNPKNDPDLRNGSIDFARVPAWAWILATLAITALILRKKS